MSNTKDIKACKTTFYQKYLKEFYEFKEINNWQQVMQILSKMESEEKDPYFCFLIKTGIGQIMFDRYLKSNDENYLKLAVENFELANELKIEEKGYYDCQKIASVHYQLGLLYLSQIELDKAKEAFSKVIQNSELRYNLDAKILYALLESHQGLDVTNFLNECYQQWSTSNDVSFEPLILMGLLAKKEGNFTLAVNYFCLASSFYKDPSQDRKKIQRTVDDLSYAWHHASQPELGKNLFHDYLLLKENYVKLSEKSKETHLKPDLTLHHA